MAEDNFTPIEPGNTYIDYKCNRCSTVFTVNTENMLSLTQECPVCRTPGCESTEETGLLYLAVIPNMNIDELLEFVCEHYTYILLGKESDSYSLMILDRMRALHEERTE